MMRSSADRPQYAYKVEHVVNRNRLEAVLQDLGKEGWLLVSADWSPPGGGVTLILSRPYLTLD